MTLVLVALLIVVIMVTAAAVIDLSVVRQNRQDDKNATDFAAAAGIRALDDGTGGINVWDGICTARDYLVSNRPELSPLTHIDPTTGSVLATDPCASPAALHCTSSASWRTYRGLADDGRIRITIQNGYDLSASGFSEDSDEYSGDEGDNPCEHLAVIIEESEDPYFGGVAGSSGYETTIRSVARLNQGGHAEVAPALLLLERTKCAVLLIGGDSGAVVTVEGFGISPGSIHADTDGTHTSGNEVTTCRPTDAENGNIFQVNSNPDTPRIISAASSDDSAAGEMTAVAMGGSADQQAVASSPRPKEVCIEVTSDDCTTSPLSSGPIVERGLVSRSVVDSRYLTHVKSLRAEAADRLSWDTTTQQANGYLSLGCNDAIPSSPNPDPDAPSGSKIWIECNGNAFDGSGKTFPSFVEEVVISGYITIGGQDSVLNFASVEKLYVQGRSGGAGVSLAGGEGNKFVVNAGSDPTASCPSSAANTDGVARIVVMNGSLETSGQSTEENPKVLRLCQSMVLMADDTDGSCSVDDVAASDPGEAPYPNTCIGRVRVAGQATVDWTAPNVKHDTFPVPSDFQHFEDLAFWSETESAGTEWGILGNGFVKLAGIFFTPNADPIKVGGNGTYNITDAQFVTRRLEVTGNAGLTMRPDPRNSVTIDAIEGFSLVR